jgi:hypothetical protein
LPTCLVGAQIGGGVWRIDSEGEWFGHDSDFMAARSNSASAVSNFVAARLDSAAPSSIWLWRTSIWWQWVRISDVLCFVSCSSCEQSNLASVGERNWLSCIRKYLSRRACLLAKG